MPDAPTLDTLLAFDTSTDRMAVAVQTAAGRWLADAEGGAAASATLLPVLHGLLARAGRAMADVVAIGFGRGPGAFTGLRTSCAIAQGLAFGLARPALPIDSLMLVAEQARQRAGGGDGFEVGVAMDARMGEVYAARYRQVGGRWQELQAPGLWTPARLVAQWAPDPPAVASGSALAVFEAEFMPACPRARWIDAGPARAAALLTLADQAWRDGAGVDAAQALPLYLRDKVAQTTAERAAQRAAEGR